MLHLLRRDAALENRAAEKNRARLEGGVQRV
jgi:hypothetical protein